MTKTRSRIGTARLPSKNDEAQFRLGLCYEKGHGVSRDINKAVELYRKEATQDNEDAQKALKRLGYGW